MMNRNGPRHHLQTEEKNMNGEDVLQGKALAPRLAQRACGLVAGSEALQHEIAACEAGLLLASRRHQDALALLLAPMKAGSSAGSGPIHIDAAWLRLLDRAIEAGGNHEAARQAVQWLLQQPLQFWRSGLGSWRDEDDAVARLAARLLRYLEPEQAEKIEMEMLRRLDCKPGTRDERALAAFLAERATLALGAASLNRARERFFPLLRKDGKVRPNLLAALVPILLNDPELPTLFAEANTTSEWVHARRTLIRMQAASGDLQAALASVAALPDGSHQGSALFELLRLKPEDQQLQKFVLPRLRKAPKRGLKKPEKTALAGMVAQAELMAGQVDAALKLLEKMEHGNVRTREELVVRVAQWFEAWPAELNLERMQSLLDVLDNLLPQELPGCVVSVLPVIYPAMPLPMRENLRRQLAGLASKMWHESDQGVIWAALGAAEARAGESAALRRLEHALALAELSGGNPGYTFHAMLDACIAAGRVANTALRVRALGIARVFATAAAIRQLQSAMQRLFRAQDTESVPALLLSDRLPPELRRSATGVWLREALACQETPVASMLAVLDVLPEDAVLAWEKLAWLRLALLKEQRYAEAESLLS